MIWLGLEAEAQSQLFFEAPTTSARIKDYMGYKIKDHKRIKDMPGSTIGKAQMRIDLKTMTIDPAA